MGKKRKHSICKNVCLPVFLYYLFTITLIHPVRHHLLTNLLIKQSVILQVTVNWFQMQQGQTVLLPAHYQDLSESAKLYEPGECYAEFVRNLPKNLPKERVHSDSISSDNTRYQRL